ncbi:hypothetical protein [Aeromonas diversa]|uniref:hypothetical protein n=1 Tax=Aeromonas diversa TaxID=502790 RepID=UPI0034629DB0
MQRISLFALALLATPFTQAASAPDLAARISYEVRTTTADGIVKESRWQERWLRVGDTLWSERLIPLPIARAFHARHDGQSGHKHFAHQMAARWVSPDDQGAPRLRYADAWHRQVVEVPPEEYGQVAFKPDWARLRHLVDPASLAGMTALDEPAPEGARWYEQRQGSERTRVLWAERDQVALTLESGSLDGWRRYTMTLTRQPLPKTLPWLAVDTYPTLDLRDFFD